MADKKDDDKNKEIKDLEEELFKEFNEQVNLSEPTDSRLQENVELNPDMKEDEKAGEEKNKENKKDKKADDKKDDKVEAKKEEVEPEKPKEKNKEGASEVELGQAFSEFVEEKQTEEAIKSQDKGEKDKEEKPSLITKLLPIAKNILNKSVDFIKKYLRAFYQIFYKLFAPFRWFFTLTKKEKIGFVGIIIGFLAVGFLGYKFYIDYYVNPNKSPYIKSFSDLKGPEYTYDNAKNFEVFFSPAYTPDYVYVLPKVMANIKPSQNSGANPMIFVEVVLKASNQDTAIEFKDRQIEMQDRVSRTIETFNFDELRSVEGKESLKKSIAKDINRILNSGYVVDVLFNNFIVKP